MLPPRVLPNITNSQQYLLPNFTAFFRTYNHIYASKFGKLSNGHRTGKGKLSISILKKGNAKECSDYCTIALISHTSKVMLKILQARLQ